jgi:hypothetical protein
MQIKSGDFAVLQRLIAENVPARAELSGVLKQLKREGITPLNSAFSIIRI